MGPADSRASTGAPSLFICPRSSHPLTSCSGTTAFSAFPYASFITHTCPHQLPRPSCLGKTKIGERKQKQLVNNGMAAESNKAVTAIYKRRGHLLRYQSGYQ